MDICNRRPCCRRTFGRFMRYNCKKNQKEFTFEKVVTAKGNQLYVKWKHYDNSFNNWIDKKDLVASKPCSNSKKYINK